MTVASIRAILYEILTGIPDIGTTSDYYRWAVLRSDFLDKFKTTVDSVDQIRWWGLTFLGWSSVQEDFGRDDIGIVRGMNWRVDGFMTWDDDTTSQKTFETLVETVCDAIDGSYGLNNDDVCLSRDPSTCVIEPRMLGGVLCHHVDITMTIYEMIQSHRQLFYDTFTDDDYTRVTAHTPDVDVAGNGWDDVTGDIIIENGQAYVQIGGDQTAIVDCEVPNCTLITKLYSMGDNDKSSLCARYSDADNYWLIELDTAGAGAPYSATLKIIERNATVETTRATGNITLTAAMIAAGIEIKAVLHGTTIWAYAWHDNNQSEISYTAASLNSNATKHGFHSPANNSKFDSFEVRWSR